MKETKKKNPWISVGVLVFSAFVATFNETILNVALIPIAHDMAVSSATVQWLITGYMLVTSVMVPVTAFLYQSISTRKLFLGALGIIFIGSIGCFIASDFPILLASRMIQAVGTGMMIPIMMNSVLIIAPRNKIGMAMALCVCGITLGPAFAPSISGIIIQFFQWKAVFILFIALVIISIILGVFVLDNIAELTRPHLDIISVILSTLGLAALLYGISCVMSSHFIGIACIIIGILIIATFVYRQKGLEEPLLNFKPFFNTRFTLGVVMVFVAMLINFSLNTVMPSFLQGAFYCSSMISAMVLLPGILLNAMSTNISGKILDKYGARIMLPAGFIVTAIALFSLSCCNSSTKLLFIVIFHIIIYQGLAFTMSPAQTSALATLEPNMNAHGVAIVNTSMQIAASIGSSLLGGIQSAEKTVVLLKGASKSTALFIGFSRAIFAAFIIGIIGLIASIVYNVKLQKNERKAA